MNWTDPRRAVSPPAARIALADPRVKSTVLPVSGWHTPGTPAPAAIASPSTPRVDPFRTQVTHPQPPEQPRQTVLE
jgi:hypothetical protein